MNFPQKCEDFVDYSGPDSKRFCLRSSHFAHTELFSAPNRWSDVSCDYEYFLYRMTPDKVYRTFYTWTYVVGECHPSALVEDRVQNIAIQEFSRLYMSWLRILGKSNQYFVKLIGIGSQTPLNRTESREPPVQIPSALLRTNE